MIANNPLFLHVDSEDCTNVQSDQSLSGIRIAKNPLHLQVDSEECTDVQSDRLCQAS